MSRNLFWYSCDTGRQSFGEQAIAASWRGGKMTPKNFVSVAAAECVGSGFIYRLAFLDRSAGCRHNSYARVLHKFGRVGPWTCVQYVSACARLIVRSRQAACSFAEATYVPSVQEMKQGENENTVHPQMTRKARAGPCPEREVAIFMFCLCVCVMQILFHC